MTVKVRKATRSATAQAKSHPKASSNIRVYRYWCEPVAKLDEIKLRAQLVLAMHYRRQLVAIENKARNAIADLDSDVVKFKRRKLVAMGRYGYAIRTTLSELPLTHPHCTRLRAQCAIVEAAQTRLKEELAALFTASRQDTVRRDAIAAIFKNRNAEIRVARKAIRKLQPTRLGGDLTVDAGIYWASYLVVEDAHERACKSMPLYKRLRVDPIYDEGTIAVQIQAAKGKPPFCGKHITATSNLLVQLDPRKYAVTRRVDGFREAALVPIENNRGAIKPTKLQQLKLRVGSDARRKPVWAAFHVLMHRDLPPDGHIKWVKVHRVKTGLIYRYEVHFSVDLAAVKTEAPPSAPAAICGIDLGWRKVPQGIRIAYLVGSDGYTSELIASNETVRRAPKSAELRALRDNKRNAMRALLTEWRRLAPRKKTAIDIQMDQDRTVTVNLTGMVDDCWWRESTRFIHQWLKIGHFAALFNQWKTQRFAGDAEVFAVVEEWLKKDRHLLSWEAHNVRRMKLQLTKQYEMWAVKVAKRYSTVAVETLDLSQLREKVKSHTDAEKWLQGHTASVTQVVAPGKLLQQLKTATEKFTRQLVKVDAANTTKMCAECNHIRDTSLANGALVLTCGMCGYSEDQDRTAARNILARASASEPASSVAPLAPQRRPRKSADPRPRAKTKAAILDSHT